MSPGGPLVQRWGGHGADEVCCGRAIAEMTRVNPTDGASAAPPDHEPSHWTPGARAEREEGHGGTSGPTQIDPVSQIG
jgi:hypothetical protein